eukprot:6720814-Prymnesium_polylepis.1
MQPANRLLTNPARRLEQPRNSMFTHTPCRSALGSIPVTTCRRSRSGWAYAATGPLAIKRRQA